MRNSAYYLAFALASVHVQKVQAAESVCDGMMPPAIAVAATRRPVEMVDLIRLRDIGYSHLAPGQKLLSLSPDKRSIAFSMFRADPERNAYCEAIFILDRSNGRLRKISETGELILEAYPIRGVKVDYGYPKPIVPVWSPNGQWVAYLKRADGRTQIWRASSDGSREQMLSSSPVDVDRFAWTRDGSAIIYESRPGLIEAEEAIDQEASKGYLFDDRVVPYSGSRPLVRLPLPIHTSRLNLADGQTREANQADIAQLPPADPFDPTQNMRNAVSDKGRKAWIERRDPNAHLSPLDLWAEDSSGLKHRCPDAACGGTPYVGIQQLWWSADGRDVLFMRREGWANSRTALYQWSPNRSKARRLLVTDDLLLGCELAGDHLLCAREGSTLPRRLVDIDVRRGTEHMLMDPNPEFGAVQLGAVERLQWRTKGGDEVFGDLVLPRGIAPRGLPLIVVQYLSTGFLRGGIGDEYPIQLFASAGYAVLSFNAPSTLPKWDGSDKSFEETVALTTRNWSARRTKFDALEAGIRELVARGIVDPAHIGATGASDGTATIQYALVNRPALFAASSVSSCCEEPTAFMLYGGTALAEERAAWGFPPARGPGSEAWAPISITMHADAVKAPTLMQLADHEYLTGLDTFMSLRSAHVPVEMRIFPGEYHLKWQPTHRLTAYRRNLQWFDFWLRGREDADPVDADQYVRWREMRSAQAR